MNPAERIPLLLEDLKSSSSIKGGLYPVAIAFPSFLTADFLRAFKLDLPEEQSKQVIKVFAKDNESYFQQIIPSAIRFDPDFDKFKSEVTKDEGGKPTLFLVENYAFPDGHLPQDYEFWMRILHLKPSNVNVIIFDHVAHAIPWLIRRNSKYFLEFSFKTSFEVEKSTLEQAKDVCNPPSESKLERDSETETEEDEARDQFHSEEYVYVVKRVNLQSSSRHAFSVELFRSKLSAKLHVFEECMDNLEECYKLEYYDQYSGEQEEYLEAFQSVRLKNYIDFTNEKERKLQWLMEAARVVCYLDYSIEEKTLN